MWKQVVLFLFLIGILPFYKQVENTFRSIVSAKKDGTWGQIPTRIPLVNVYSSAIKEAAALLKISTSLEGNTVKVKAADFKTVLLFLHTLQKLPGFYVKKCLMQSNKDIVIGDIVFSIPQMGRGSERFALEVSEFYIPRFSYVNAQIEVDGVLKIWVNGKECDKSCPWPLYHTFDHKTGALIQGDKRPLLRLTSEA